MYTLDTEEQTVHRSLWRNRIMYTHKNFKSKKALKEAVAAGEKLTYFQPGPFGGNETQNGRITLEGPHYPEPHRWYAEAVVKDGVIVKVK